MSGPWPIPPFLSPTPHSGSAINLLVETLRAGTQMEMGLKLYPAFVAAGLPAPSMRAERLASDGPGYPGYHCLVGLVRSVLPMMEQLGVATAEEVEIETLVERLRDEIVALSGAIAFSSFMGAWTRKPVEQAEARDFRTESERHEQSIREETNE